MTLRLVTFSRQVLFRLGNSSCHRCLSSKKSTEEHPTAPGSLGKKFSLQKKNILMNYFNQSYRGHDKRLKFCQSTMDRVYKVVTQSGHLKSLNDLVEVVGLSPSEAIELCEEIGQVVLKRRRKMQYSYPTFTVEDAQSVENILAIHTSLYCITWAHMEVSGRVRSWHKEPLLIGDKQKHPIVCVKEVMKFYPKIPLADAYILETPDARRSKDKTSALNAYMLAYINCSLLSIASCLHANNKSDAKMYYMNRSIVPFLFDLSVGGEVVARLDRVEELIAQRNAARKEFQDILLDSWLVDLFTKSSNSEKEELAIPLLSAIAAMEILVRRNPYAIEKVTFPV